MIALAIIGAFMLGGFVATVAVCAVQLGKQSDERLQAAE